MVQENVVQPRDLIVARKHCYVCNLDVYPEGVCGQGSCPFLAKRQQPRVPRDSRTGEPTFQTQAPAGE